MHCYLPDNPLWKGSQSGRRVSRGTANRECAGERITVHGTSRWKDGRSAGGFHRSTDNDELLGEVKRSRWHSLAVLGREKYPVLRTFICPARGWQDGMIGSPLCLGMPRDH